MQRTTFQNEAADALAKAGFQPVSPEIQPYKHHWGGSASEVWFKWAISGSDNEIIVVLRDNYATIRAIRHSDAKLVYSDANSLVSANTAQKVLEKARFAYRLAVAEPNGCRRISVRTNAVCGEYLVDGRDGGYVCSCQCWLKNLPKKWGSHTSVRWRKY